MREDFDSGDIELGDYIAIVRRRWRWVVAPVLVLSIAGFWYSNSRPAVYEATARVLLSDSAAQQAIAGGTGNINALNRQLANEINLAQADQTKALIADRLGLSPDDRLPRGTIKADSGSDVLSFTFTANEPDDAATYANTWAQSYVDIKRSEAEESITSTVEELQSRLDDLRTARSDLRADLEDLVVDLATAPLEDRALLQLQVDQEEASISDELTLIDTQITANIESITQLQLSGELAGSGTARVFQQASPPVIPTNAPASRGALVGAILGIIAGIALALLRDNLDQTVATAEDLADLGLTPLGFIPEASKALRRQELALIGITDPASPVADGYQKVRTAIQFASLSTEIRSIVVTSPLQGEGKTTTSTNLALSFAGVGRDVVLVDADLRRPRLHSIFNTALVPGVVDALAEGLSLDQIAIRTHDSPESLAVLPAGTQPPNPAMFLASPTYAELAADLTEAADLVIYDAPPVLPVADALSICQHVDGVIMVASARSTKRDDLAQAVNNVVQAGGRLLGIVLVGVANNGRYGSYYGVDKPTAAAPRESDGTRPAKSISTEARQRSAKAS